MYKREFYLILLILLLLTPVSAKEYFLEPMGCYLDIPQGWEPVEITDTKATFTDTAQKGYLQIKVSPADTWASSPEIFEAIGNQIQADSEGDEFIYLGNDTAFATYLFPIGETFYQGFGVLINGEDFDWVILAFAEALVYEPYQFFLLSALDSFSINVDGLYNPGPVSQYFQYSYDEADFFQDIFYFEDEDFLFEFDGNGMETAELVVERETAVLGRYTPEDVDAWSRYYRMIYRDNYKRVDGLFRQFLFNGLKRSEEPVKIAGRLLAWIQDFEYSRTGTVTDFLPPLSALYNYTGDCDSLGLLYVILLKHYGIDSILMVSSEYSHALAAVDVEGEGARFPFQEKGYMIAETTDKVALGMIAASMADPAKWLGISFN
ncbi:MAG: hypothetical protein JEY99_11850 [Spirochaetales bacterium]|nr:hypothetical protein [Spirochaetales bacterium]